MLQKLITLAVRPYVSRELPGWGKLFGLTADYRRDWIWRNAHTVDMADKLSGMVTTLDLSYWPDRTTYFLGRWHDAHLMLFASQHIKPTDTVLDVGANRGEFSLFASTLARQVIAFEPNPKMVSVLQRDIARNSVTNIRVEPFGLGNENSSAALYVPKHNSGEASFCDNGGEQVTAKIRRGDDLGLAPNFIKIDVEGFEPLVLDGLRKTIATHRPVIVTEIVRSNLEHIGSSPEDIQRTMRSLRYTGYRLSLKGSRAGMSSDLLPFDANAASFDAAWLPD
jgi:FkbM family methyltransferase